MSLTGVHGKNMFWKTKLPSSKPDSAVEQEGAVQRADSTANGFQLHPENRDLPVLEGNSSLLPAVPSQRGYVIPSGYRISGAILTSRPVVVSGEIVSGLVDAPSLTVLPGGGLGASAHVQVIKIHGAVSGDIIASNLVDVSAQGEVSGEVRSPAIRVAPGARIAGASLAIGAN
jgi:cytoskeletal protein CcmA (bactofilin family)